MTKRKMKATVTVYPMFSSITFDIAVRFDAYEGDTPEQMKASAAQTFRYIGYDVKPHETITIEEAN